jgi:hypothetical protein
MNKTFINEKPFVYENYKPNSTVVKGQVKGGLCSKKNYFVIPTKEENYTFLSGTVRPPFQRQFNMHGVT